MSDFGHRAAAEAVANGGLGLISGARDGPDGLGVMRQGGGGEVRTDPGALWSSSRRRKPCRRRR